MPFSARWGSPHWHLAVRTFLNEHLPNRWIGRAGQNDQVFCKWPPRSPDLTACDFFLWGYAKVRVYVPPPPATVDELQERITAAVKSVTPDMLQTVWSELDYRIDFCQVTTLQFSIRLLFIDKWRGKNIQQLSYRIQLVEGLFTKYACCGEAECTGATGIRQHRSTAD